MIQRHLVPLAGGVGAFALGTLLGSLGIIYGSQAGGTWTAFFIALVSVAVSSFLLLGMELIRYALDPWVNYYGLFSRGFRGLLVDGGTLLLAVCLMLGTLIYQRPDDPFCAGGLSAGFPVAVVCDDGGGSPLSSAGRIDWSDIANIHPAGLFLDTLFYYMALGFLYRALSRRLQGDRISKDSQSTYP